MKKQRLTIVLLLLVITASITPYGGVTGGQVTLPTTNFGGGQGGNPHNAPPCEPAEQGCTLQEACIDQRNPAVCCVRLCTYICEDGSVTLTRQSSSTGPCRARP
jgi:hypothetical protein